MATLKGWNALILKDAEIADYCTLMIEIDFLIRNQAVFDIMLPEKKEVACLYGVVSGHERLHDGKYIVTSPIQRIRSGYSDNSYELIADTWNTEYHLSLSEMDDYMKIVLRRF